MPLAMQNLASAYDAAGTTKSVFEPLVAQSRALLASLHHPALLAFLNDWPTGTGYRQVTPSATLPVLGYLKDVPANATRGTLSLAREVARKASSMSWRQTYTVPAVSPEFLENYGWSELFGLSGPLPSERLACGFLLLGPAILYPRHRHAAQEIYVPLSGRALWQRGDLPWREQAPGSLIYHASNEPHSMRTLTEPLLALYLWHGSLQEKAHLGCECQQVRARAHRAV